MDKVPISAVWPLQDGVLQIVFETGSAAVVSFQEKLQVMRFRPLQDEAVWRSVQTDGQFIRWYRDGFPVVEMACDELLGMIVGSAYY